MNPTSLHEVAGSILGLARASGLRIPCCHRFWQQNKQLVGRSCGSNSTPSLGTSTCLGCAPTKKKKKKKKKKKRKEKTERGGGSQLDTTPGQEMQDVGPGEAVQIWGGLFLQLQRDSLALCGLPGDFTVSAQLESLLLLPHVVVGGRAC